MSTEEYFDHALSLIAAAPHFYTDKLSLAGRRIDLRTPSLHLRSLFLFSLSHLITEDDAIAPKLTIWYTEDSFLPGRLAPPPWTGFNNQGFSAEISQEDVQVFFQPWQKQIFLYSRSKQTGIYWAKTAADVPWWETTFSFRTIFHFWTRDLPSQLVHAGAIASGDTSGVLITGQGGSGKSTSCLNLARAGYKYLGDDYVWVELEPEPVVHTLYQTAKIEPDNLHERFADWKAFISNPEKYHEQKAVFNMRQLLPYALIPSSGLKAILLPSVAGTERSHIERVPPSRALLGMAPTTLHHLPHQRERSYQKLKQISSRLPAYIWSLGYDADKFLSSFTNFMSE